MSDAARIPAARPKRRLYLVLQAAVVLVCGWRIVAMPSESLAAAVLFFLRQRPAR